MARKYFEQMLFDELELGNYPGFQRWYPTPNPVCYGIPDIHQDFRNVTRMNRYDLHPFDYYRQSYWMPQSLVFPSYETFCLLRRNDRRGFHSKNYHFSRDKRINGERRLYPNRHEEGNNFRVDRGKTSDFLLPFEKRYQQGWHHREAQQYQLSRDERNMSRLSYRNSNTDLCPENIMIDQHLHNFKQMFASRNPSSERLSVNENMSQTGSNVNENVMHIGSPVYCKTSDVEWKDQPDKSQKNQFSDGSQFAVSPNFDNGYASWYCPEEPQQIVDMLKEVNLRHDRQLRRDMLLSRGEQPSSEESMSSNNDTQMASCIPESSSSEEEDEDTVTILMHPVDVPAMPESINDQDEEMKSGYHEKSASDFFEEFQNIFTGSPEKKIINNLTKENLKRPQVAEEEDFAVLGRIITDDDKNAVKTVLDFDNVDDLTEKTLEKCQITSSSSPKESTVEILLDTIEIPESHNKNISTLGVLNNNKIDNDVFQSLNEKTKSRPLKIVNSETSQSVEEIQSSSVQPMAFLKHTATNLHMSDSSQTTNDKKSPDQVMSDSNKPVEHSHKNILVTPTQNRRQSNNDSTIKNGLNNIYVNESSDDVKSSNEATCNINRKVKKSYEKKSLKIETLLFDDVKNSSITSRNTEIACPTNFNKKTSITGTNCSQETDTLCSSTDNRSKDSEASLYPNKNLRKEESVLSMSEPLLMHKSNDVVYKRISLSEIFDSFIAKPENNFEKTPINMLSGHAFRGNSNVRQLSPTEHLKQILGIGRNAGKNKSENDNCENDFSNELPSNKNKFSQDLKTKADILSNFHSSKDTRNIFKSSLEKASPKYPCCMLIQDSTAKENMYHKNPPSKVEACNPEVSKNRKQFQKINKFIDRVENGLCNLNSNRNYSQDEYNPIMNGVQACKSKNGTEHNSSMPDSNKNIFKKGRSYKENHIVKQSNSEICEIQTDIIDLSIENLKSKHKVTSDEHAKLVKSSQQIEATNMPRQTNDYFNKSKKEKMKEGSLKYTKRRKDLREKEPGSDLDDSQMSVCSGKDFEESRMPTMSKLDLPKTRKKFKKKRKKEKFVNECNGQEIKQISIRNNEVEQTFKANDTLEISSGNQNEHKYSNSEASEEKSRQSIVVNSSKDAALTSLNIADNSYEHSKFETNGSILENFNEINSKSFFDVTNTESNLGVQSPPELQEVKSAANMEKKSSRIFKSLKIKDNKGKFDFPIKGHEPREGSRYWKNKACGSERNYTFDEKKMKTFAYNSIKQAREQKPHKYVRQDHSEDDKNITLKYSNPSYDYTKNSNLKESKSNSFKKHKKVTPEESNFKIGQNVRCHGVEKGLSSLENEISIRSKAVSASKPEAICHSTNLEDKICRSASSNPIYENQTSSNLVAQNIPFIQSESLSYFPVNSEFLAVMKNIRLKTQQMLEEAEKIAYFCGKGVTDISFPKEWEWKRKQQNYCGNHVVSKANTELSLISVTKDDYDYPLTHLVQEEKNNSYKISTKSLNLTALGTLRRMKYSSCIQFPKDISYASIYTKGKGDVVKRPVSAIEFRSKEFREKIFKEQILLNIPQNIIMIAPMVMENYLRNKQALKLNHLLDVPVQIYLQDFLSDFNSVKSSPALQNSLQLSLGAVIRKNLAHTLPLLLNSLSLLSKFDIPWTRDCLKELLEVCYFCEAERTDSKLLKLQGEEVSHNYANEVLSCWDLISSYFTNREASAR